MSFLNRKLLCLVIPAAMCSLTGCQDDPAKQGGTYTAARHTATGSHVPQASDINSANSVYAPSAGQESIGGTAVLPHDSGH